MQCHANVHDGLPARVLDTLVLIGTDLPNCSLGIP